MRKPPPEAIAQGAVAEPIAPPETPNAYCTPMSSSILAICASQQRFAIAEATETGVDCWLLRQGEISTEGFEWTSATGEEVTVDLDREEMEESDEYFWYVVGAGTYETRVSCSDFSVAIVLIGRSVVLIIGRCT